MCIAEMYVKDIESGITANSGTPRILNEKAATAHVDGNNVLGPVVGSFAMEIAIRKAKDTGVGWVVAKGIYLLSMMEVDVFFLACLCINLHPT